MNEFAIASDKDFEVLKARSQNQCAVFPARRLPRGCSRDNARVGVESPDGSTVSLLVERGISYSGANVKLRSLFDEGKLDFANFEALKLFLRTDVKQEFYAHLVPEGCMSPPYDEGFPVLAPPVSPRRDLARTGPRELTDFDRITEQLERQQSHVLIDATELATALKQRVVGQDDAIDTLAGMAARQVNRSSPRRPASIYMLGTTGVGKTKAAVALAECLSELGAPYSFLRLDMSEYQEQHRVSQLLGAPQGYLGHGEGAQLPNRLARTPKMVVVLDEFEKAHPDVHTAFMNIFGSGRLSSSKAIDGKYEIDCKDTIFVLTSNLEADALLAAVDDAPGAQNVEALCRKHLTEHRMLPELVGRIGGFCLFRPLTSAQRARILVMAVAMVAREYGVEVEYVAPDVVVQLLNESDSRFGARPDEQAVDRIFGETFARANRRGVRSIRLMEYPSVGSPA